MKAPLLCSLLLVWLIAAAPAQQSQTPVNPTWLTAVQNSSAAIGKARAAAESLPASDDGFLFKIQPDRPTRLSAESFCAYIRTYRVRREYPGSDLVTSAGYTTCAPTKRFELRSAVAATSDSVEVKADAKSEVKADVKDDATNNH